MTEHGQVAKWRKGMIFLYTIVSSPLVCLFTLLLLRHPSVTLFIYLLLLRYSPSLPLFIHQLSPLPFSLISLTKIPNLTAFTHPLDPSIPLSSVLQTFHIYIHENGKYESPSTQVLENTFGTKNVCLLQCFLRGSALRSYSDGIVV